MPVKHDYVEIYTYINLPISVGEMTPTRTCLYLSEAYINLLLYLRTRPAVSCKALLRVQDTHLSSLKKCFHLNLAKKVCNDLSYTLLTSCL